jgi:hypothetical protein
MRHRTNALIGAILVSLICSAIRTAAAPAVDPAATAAVQQYISAMRSGDFARAYAHLTPAQQTYFGDVANFASNYTQTGYRLISSAMKSATSRSADVVQVEVAEKFAFYDIGVEQPNSMAGVEPYFALRVNGRWGVKELFEPWKTYAPNATARSGGLSVAIDRVEYYDHRVQIDCTLRNLGQRPYQVLPLLKSHLQLVPGTDANVMNGPDFPLNDRDFFEGVRIYPGHQIVGYLNFVLSSRKDADSTMTLTVGPAIEDGANQPVEITVGPVRLQKL